MAATAKAGYRCAFLTRQDFAPNHANVHDLPSTTISNAIVANIGLFRAYVQGDHIPLERMKRKIFGGFRRYEKHELAASVPGDSILGDFAA